MLSLQRPNSSMEQDFAHGLSPSAYEQERQRRAWGEHVPYSAPYSGDASTTQLPPIQTARNPYEQTSSSSYDPVRRPPPLPTTAGQSYSPYTTQPPQSPYGHGMAQYPPHNQHLYSQSTPQMSPLAPQFPSSTYSPIRPMPALAPGQPHNMSGGYTPTSGYNFPQQSEEPAEPQQRLHVVGSQGRRGVLPSDDGRPPAIPNGATGTKSTVIPQKDADGKFPCPHCQKTYLHGKHLKRHLLRHTGDRPYSCFLCNDTFSRSDILKRHFQKCSQRRGNPTGASHLAYSQNHLKRQAAKSKQQQQQQAAQQGGAGDSSSDGNLPSVSQAVMNNNTTASIYADPNHYGDGRDSRSSGGLISPGLNRPSHSFMSGQPGSASLPSSGSTTPLTAKTTNGQFPSTYQTDATHRSGYPEMQHRHQLPQISGASQYEGNAFEWSSTYPQGKESSGSVFSDDPHIAGQSIHSNNSDNQQEPFKTPAIQGGLHDGILQAVTLMSVDQVKADRLVELCQLHDPVTPLHDHLRQSLTPNNIQHFIQQYFENFYRHFPILHIPSFDPNTACETLLLAIICTGSVYSDRLEIGHTRELAKIVGNVLKRELDWVLEPSHNIDLNDNSRIDEISEQLHAYVSILSLSLWHGDDTQKIEAMENWPTCTTLALRLNLDTPAGISSSNFSAFHQPGNVEDQSLDRFSYGAWLWQEKRIRLMYITFLTDAILALFFNRAPTLEPLQLKIPLPCDDAAWDAPSEIECIKALGFYGSAQQVSNASGSLRKKQPEMHLALAVLHDPTTEPVPRSTNAAGKFLLIHGLLVHVWMAQTFSFLASPNLPTEDLDWVKIAKTEYHSATSPSDFSNPFEIIEMACDKWAKAWDCDIMLQYPPGIERVGYSRDGVHYYWLAKLLIHNCDYVNVRSPWNERFHQILKILKNVKSWVAANLLTRGETAGAISLIDERYGLSDLSKDLKLLLAPL